MKILISSLLLVIVVSACGGNNDHPPILRSSKNIATNEINAYILAQTHTHVDLATGEEESHTTIVIEYFGYDSDGYYFNLELSENDTLSVTDSANTGANTTTIVGKPFPSEEDALYVEYSTDIDTTEGGTELLITLNRQQGAEIVETHFTLPEATEITATPSHNSAILYDDEVSLTWESAEDTNYSLKITQYCTATTGGLVRQFVYLPCNTEGLALPVTYTPSTHFSLPDSTSATSCRIRNALYSSENLTPTEETTPYKSVIIQASRENVIDYSFSG